MALKENRTTAPIIYEHLHFSHQFSPHQATVYVINSSHHTHANDHTAISQQAMA